MAHKNKSMAKPKRGQRATTHRGKSKAKGKK